jgi:hypothetical protein
MKQIIKHQALQLRANGYSMSEISKKLGIAQSTASLWTRNVFLDKKAKIRLNNISIVARQKSIISRKKKNEALWQNIAMRCPVLKNNKDYNINECKIFLALLYWAEGEKTGNKFAFINSDPNMIKLYLSLLRKSFKINESRFKVWLHLHKYHDKTKLISFWSHVTGICKNQFSVYNKTHAGNNKKKDYQGCLSIRYQDSRILKEILIIIKRMNKLI